MRAILEPANHDRTAPTRVLLLPAAYTGPEDFVREGFVRAVRERGLALDLMFVELSLQHLTDRTVLRRLRHELVLPSRAAGCRTLWLGGLSLGGFVALAYAERYPQEIDGLCLFAPYLGNRIITGEIERTGGLQQWMPGELAEEDDERRIWRYVKGQSERKVPLHLGFGSEDRFADGHRLMAAALAPASVDSVSGEHDWPTWRRLWENFLDRRFPTDECLTP